VPQMYCFPFEPNWQKGVKYRLTVPNKIITSYDGHEQRILLRGSPAIETEAQYLLGSSEDSALFEMALWYGQGIGIFLPMWLHGSLLNADVAKDSTKLPKPTTAENPYFNAGLHVALIDIERNSEYEVLNVQSVVGDTINVYPKVSKDWLKRTCFIVPMMVARIPENMQIIKSTSRISSLTVVMEYQNTEYSVLGEAPSIAEDYTGVPMFKGIEFTGEESNRAEDLVFAFSRDIRSLDFDTGIKTVIPKSDHSTLTRDFKIICFNVADIQKWVNWVGRRRGRNVPFWCPSGNNDVEVMDDIGAASSTLRVRNWPFNLMYRRPGTGYDNQIHQLRSHLAVYSNRGVYYPTKILNVGTHNPDGSMDLNIEPLGVDLPLTSVAMTSFLHHSRLSNDTVEFNFFNTKNAEVNFKIQDAIYDRNVKTIPSR